MKRVGLSKRLRFEILKRDVARLAAELGPKALVEAMDATAARTDITGWNHEVRYFYGVIRRLREEASR